VFRPKRGCFPPSTTTIPGDRLIKAVVSASGDRERNFDDRMPISRLGRGSQALTLAPTTSPLINSLNVANFVKMSVDPNSSEAKAGDASSNAVSAADRRTLQAELAAERERYLRLAADFDNFRKRTARETERSAAAQKEAFIRDLLPVIDNLERALGSDISTSPAQLRQGVQLTIQQLTQLLRLHGVEPEECLGRRFDPLYHEAVSVRHDPSKPDQMILETFQRGYRRGDVVFRPAKVVVNDLRQSEDESGRG
jgi:molecular chaperone GrpE